MDKRLAYLDSSFGLVPCRVESVEPMEWPNPYGKTHVRVTVTADRGCYKRGQETTYSEWRVIPRESVINRRSMSGARVVGNWNWTERLQESNNG